MVFWQQVQLDGRVAFIGANDFLRASTRPVGYRSYYDERLTRPGEYRRAPIGMGRDALESLFPTPGIHYLLDFGFR